jgi:hypothetical protein
MRALRWTFQRRQAQELRMQNCRTYLRRTFALTLLPT